MMSRLLGYMCSDDTLTPYAMREVQQEAWPTDEEQVETLGFGWLQESRTLLRKHPSRGDDPVNVLGLLCDIPARTLVGHLAREVEATRDTLDLQPFRFRKWLFTQCGSVPGLAEFQEDIVADMPDHIRRNIQGQNDAEVVFHRLYQRMSEREAFDGGRADGPKVVDALADTLEEFDERSYEAGSEEPLRLNLMAATERFLVAARLDTPVHYKVFDGIDQPGEEPLFAGHRPRRIEHPHFDGAFVASGLKPENDQWRELGQGEILWIDDSWQAHTRSLEDAGS